MDVKLGEFRFFDFDTIDPETGLPAAPFAIETKIFQAAAGVAIAYDPGVATRDTDGTYTVPVEVTEANGFSVGSGYAVRASVQFVDGGDVYSLALGNFIVRQYSIDDVGAKTRLINTAQGVVSSPASNGSDGPELTLRMRDDFTDENGQPIEITLPSDFPDITAVPVTDIYLGFGPEFGSSEIQFNATEIVQSGPAVDQIVKFEPREADTTDLDPDNSWKATCLVVYSSSHRRSFNLNLEVERSWVE
jgi:hypothetical protein